MNEYNFNKTVNISKIVEEIKSSSIQKNLTTILEEVGNCTIIFEEELSNAEETVLDSIISNHDIADMEHYLIGKIEDAMEFGQKMMVKFSAENVGMGITQANKTKEVLSYLANVKNAMETGSLYTVLEEIDSLILAGIPAELSPFVTQQRLEDFKASIQAYLGM